MVAVSLTTSETTLHASNGKSIKSEGKDLNSVMEVPHNDSLKTFYIHEPLSTLNTRI